MKFSCETSSLHIFLAFSKSLLSYLPCNGVRKRPPPPSTANLKKILRASDLASNSTISERNSKPDYLLARSIMDVAYFLDLGGKSVFAMNFLFKGDEMFRWIYLSLKENGGLKPARRTSVGFTILPWYSPSRNQTCLTTPFF